MYVYAATVPMFLLILLIVLRQLPLIGNKIDIAQTSKDLFSTVEATATQPALSRYCVAATGSDEISKPVLYLVMPCRL